MDLSGADKIVIAGAGQAAAQAVQSLRQGGYKGALTIVGEETALPYQRPPLSKAYMKGEMDEERLYFKPAAWYQDNNIEVILGAHATRIDRAARQLHIEHGGVLDYDALILATGSRPRKLPCQGADLAGVHDLRTLSDVERIRPQMVSGRRMVIIGAGYIGLEAAAVACTMGLEVTVLEMAPRVLARVTSPVMSDFYAHEHTAKGVKILTNTALSHLDGADGAVSAAVLADGTRLPADIVLVGIGILPNEELAKDAGIACANGILTDRDGRTSDPRVFAAGDCASRPLVHYGRTGRLESVHNAIEQGKLVAAAILGLPRPAEDCPWFWSDQYDLKLQIAGLSTDYDTIVLRGDPKARKFAAFYLRQGTLIAVDAVNSAPEFLASKKLIMAGAKIAPEILSDTSIPMKDIAATAAA
ncbi:pyridine nucleotide-disulfide oxidoreductase [Hyphomonas sp. CACIAM 19H1]|uniref:NAD(P)/FAD-dependent oxidoreductase n=1 Tax=Hyphomonas sp. CACIAM 19H1 TaxID=1873716 RepID=UPI000DED70E5|nr:FAD-dependent oxidoreductase [Hyphomonas sp. CACIAM 19H1]AXE64315.1 pyridine nucleotide-disulfide oxidoreductase [Hyphomonas sp. CACIAM 19H1]